MSLPAESKIFIVTIESVGVRYSILVEETFGLNVFGVIFKPGLP